MQTLKKFLTVLGISLLTTLPVSGIYIGGAIGYLIDNEEEMMILNVGTAFSQTDTVIHNVEFELGYVEYSEELGGVDFTAFMANYLMKSNPERGLGFYAGAGIGLVYYDLITYDNVNYLGYSGDVVAFQLLGGIQYAINPSTSLKIGYRYLSLDDIDVDGIMVSMDDSMVEVGVSFNF